MSCVGLGQEVCPWSIGSVSCQWAGLIGLGCQPSYTAWVWCAISGHITGHIQPSCMAWVWCAITGHYTPAQSLVVSLGRRRPYSNVPRPLTCWRDYDAMLEGFGHGDGIWYRMPHVFNNCLCQCLPRLSIDFRQIAILKTATLFKAMPSIQPAVS